jgi:glyoxylase-like metal-dependent hydrolase (beta-lactamase superfamily II)
VHPLTVAEEPLGDRPADARRRGGDHHPSRQHCDLPFSVDGRPSYILLSWLMPHSDTTIDVLHEGRPAYVSAQLLATERGPVLVDTGPGSTLPALRAGLERLGLAVTDLHAVLLTHIHFDHAGAIGLLAREQPELVVYVHALGARHLVDPTKLVASATRIYGDRMDSLWGPFLPVAERQIRPLAGGETLELGGRRLTVAYTPGHATHHVAYFEAADATAYVGDIGGIRVPDLPVPMPVTPPPDFNLEDWLASLNRVRAWKPSRLFCTHFGFSTRPVEHLAQLERGLIVWAEAARLSLARDEPDAARADRFHDDILAWLAGKASPGQIRSYAGFADLRASWHGLARYWRKKAAPAASG